jgi:hypothetical protein
VADDADKDWRLQIELPGEAARLRELTGGARGDDAPGGEVVITHDGDTLYAYAAAEDTIRAARATLAAGLAGEGLEGEARISHWDDEHEEWRQVDPPPSELAREAIEREDEAGEQVETRTLVATAGKLVRGEFEQSMSSWAQKLGLKCEIVEHPHLLTTQLAFTVTGAKDRVDEFAAGLKAEGWTYVRTETGVMLNPL